MTDGTKAVVWNAVWSPWGAAQAITGSATLNARFPGQWFQVEAGLHYNWHRSYDPTLGRYTQPDPLGFVDGPSVYGYALGSPAIHLDFDGRFVINPVTVSLARTALTAAAKKLLGPKPKPRKRERKPSVPPLPDPTPTPPEPPNPDEQCEDDDDDSKDCEFARKFHLDRAKIRNEHQFKDEHGALPNSLFDICACRDGSIVIRNHGQCGRSGPTISTDYRWK